MRVIAGSKRRMQLVTVEGMDTRPTTDRIKETLFNMIQDDVYGSRFLDLFAGSGQIGIEALSRGAKKAVFAEKSPKALECIRKNLQTTHLAEKACVYGGDVSDTLRRLNASGEEFDLIFMDPPYQKGLERQALTIMKDTSLLAEDGYIIVEAALEDDLSDVEDMGYKIIRRKKYKTNQHVFIIRGH